MTTGPIREEPSFKNAVIVGVSIILFLIWLLNWFTTGNAFWFVPIQPSYVPSRIIVHNYGTTETLQRGMDDFLVLQEALDDTLSSFNNTALIPVGVGESTLQDYYEEGLVLEVFYGQEVRFNIPARMRGVNQLLIPIDARHADSGYIFPGANGQWRAGALAPTDNTALFEAMRSLGYLQTETE